MAHGFLTCVRILGSVSVLSLSSSCYSRRTADDELLDFPPRVAANADAGHGGSVSADAGSADSGQRDAGSASRCTGTDVISLFLCNLTMPTPAGSNTNAVSDLTKLLDSAGGLASIASVLGAFTGGTGRPGATPGTTTPGATTQPSLIDLINLAGGLSNIATLLNGLLGGATAQPAGSNPIADLIAAFGQTGTANTRPALSNASPTLADFLDGLGLGQPQAGEKSLSTPVLTVPTTTECAAASDPSTELLCALSAAQAATSLAE